jgi:biotin carboxyl carrier protein
MMSRDYVVRIDGREIRVRTGENGRFQFDGIGKNVDIRETGEGRYSILIDGVSVPVVISPGPDRSLQLLSRGRIVRAVVETERDRLLSAAGGKATHHRTAARIVAPMPALVIKTSVAEGDEVEEGQPLAILEAMKMENEVRSPMKGKITKLAVREGQTVDKGALLVTIA